MKEFHPRFVALHQLDAAVKQWLRASLTESLEEAARRNEPETTYKALTFFDTSAQFQFLVDAAVSRIDRVTSSGKSANREGDCMAALGKTEEGYKEQISFQYKCNLIREKQQHVWLPNVLGSSKTSFAGKEVHGYLKETLIGRGPEVLGCMEGDIEPDEGPIPRMPDLKRKERTGPYIGVALHDQS